MSNGYWVDDDPTLELPVVVVGPDLDPAPSLPPLPAPSPRPVQVGTWQAVKETGEELGAEAASGLGLVLRTLSWVIKALKPLLPFGVLVLLLAGALHLVPEHQSERAVPTTTSWHLPSTTTTTQVRPTTSVPRTTTTTTTTWDDQPEPRADWNRPDWELPGWPDGQRVQVVRP